MSKLELVSHTLCPYVQRAAIVLVEKNIDHTRTNIDLANKPDWFVEMSPLGKVPVLKKEGNILFESQVIADYLDEVTDGSLYPEDPWQKAHHKAWIEFGSATLNAIAAFYNAQNKVTFEEKRQQLRAKFAIIEKMIRGPYFAGEAFHLIDGVWATIFRYLDTFDEIADFDLLTGLPYTGAWRSHLSVRPSVQSVVAKNYADELKQFLVRRQSYLSNLIVA